MLIRFLFEALPPCLGRPFEDTFENGKCTVEKNWAMVNWTEWCMWLYNVNIHVTLRVKAKEIEPVYRWVNNVDLTLTSFQSPLVSDYRDWKTWPAKRYQDQFWIRGAASSTLVFVNAVRQIREAKEERDRETERQIGEMAGKCFFHLLVSCCHNKDW